MNAPLVSSKTIPISDQNEQSVFQTKKAQKPTLWGDTYLYGLYKGVPPPRVPIPFMIKKWV